jgi:methanogenic corrinoid protein MtbC1
MSQEHINDLIKQIAGCNTVYECQVKGLLSSTLAFDEVGFNNILTTSIIQIGLEQTMIRIVFPFLNEIGILWQVGSIHPSHEHFASNIIKQKLYVAIDGNIGRYAENRKRFLLFLPENEHHSMGLLFANYLLRCRGHEVLFLGKEVPMKDLKETLGNYKPDFVFTILTSAYVNIDKQKFINTLSEDWKDSQILISGIQCLCHHLVFPENVSIIKKMDDFIQFANDLIPQYNRN